MTEGYHNRREKTRVSPKIVLVVTEGNKTEEIYFKNYKIRGAGYVLHIKHTNIKDPVGLLNYTITQIDDFDLDFEEGDTVWCVCDVDHHQNSAIQKASQTASLNKIKLILSNPSFELWYLLHFTTHQTPLNNVELIDKLKKFIPDYKKNEDVYKETILKRADALKNSKELIIKHLANKISLHSRESNPHTSVSDLIEYFLSFNI